jgi:hypothetical protein
MTGRLLWAVFIFLGRSKIFVFERFFRNQNFSAFVILYLYKAQLSLSLSNLDVN